MFKSQNLKQTDKETFIYTIDKDKDFKILQLTDLHLGLVSYQGRRISWR